MNSCPASRPLTRPKEKARHNPGAWQESIRHKYFLSPPLPVGKARVSTVTRPDCHIYSSGAAWGSGNTHHGPSPCHGSCLDVQRSPLILPVSSHQTIIRLAGSEHTLTEAESYWPRRRSSASCRSEGELAIRCYTSALDLSSTLPPVYLSLLAKQSEILMCAKNTMFGKALLRSLCIFSSRQGCN